MPDQLLPFLHRFLQASRIRSDIKDCGLLESHSIRGVFGPAWCLRTQRRRNASRKANEGRAARHIDRHSGCSKAPGEMAIDLRY
jgi:hypothetical protein